MMHTLGLFSFPSLHDFSELRCIGDWVSSARKFVVRDFVSDVEVSSSSREEGGAGSFRLFFVGFLSFKLDETVVLVFSFA